MPDLENTQNDQADDAQRDAAEDGANDMQAQESDELSGLRDALNKERGNTAASRREIARLTKEINDLKNAGKSEEERIKGERDSFAEENKTLREQIRTSNAKASVIATATRAGATNPELIFRTVRGDLDFDDNNEPTNVAKLIDDLKKDEPRLFKPVTGKGDGGAGSTTRSTANDVNAIIRRAAGRN